MTKIPRSNSDDYTTDMASQRRQFIQQKTGTEMPHSGKFSMDPSVFRGNTEHFTGVAQVPFGIAGPLLVHGEHAQGEFYIPLATTEGTLVASYNRGMKITREAGGVQVSVIEDKMNRAPVFAFENAVKAREFGHWVEKHFDTIKEIAESTTSSGRLIDIEQYSASKMRWLRFNYQCGDAAGQNMVTKATKAACDWILSHHSEGLEYYSLAGNLDTDKKHSYINYIHTRGKRVVAEITIPDLLIRKHFRTSAHILHMQRKISNVGAIVGDGLWSLQGLGQHQHW